MDQNEELRRARSQNVKRSVSFIQHTQYMMSLQQMRLLAYFMSQVKDGDSQDKTYEISIRDFYKVCGLEMTSFTRVRNLIRDTFYKSIVQLDYVDEDGNNSYMILPWFSFIKVAEKTDRIEYQFSPRVAEHLINITNPSGREKPYLFYVSDSLKYMIPFRSRYSYYLYPLLRSFQNKNEWVFELDDLKRRLDAQDETDMSAEMKAFASQNGIRRKSYSNFSLFKKNVLDPAVADINEFSNIKVVYKPEKDGHAVTRIRFIFEEKSAREKIDSESRGNCSLGSGDDSTGLIAAATPAVPDPIVFHNTYNTGEDTNPASVTIVDEKATPGVELIIDDDGSIVSSGSYQPTVDKRKNRQKKLPEEVENLTFDDITSGLMDKELKNIIEDIVEDEIPE